MHFDLMFQSPSWLCTDECDLLLDFVRQADPMTYYPVPARWSMLTTEFTTWSGDLLPFTCFDKIVWLIIIDQHWLRIEISWLNTQRQVFITGLPAQRQIFPSIAKAVARLCAVHFDDIKLRWVCTEPPAGLCGWVLLCQVFSVLQIPGFYAMPTATEIFSNSPHADSVCELRSLAHAEWDNAAPADLAWFCKTARDFFIVKILEGKSSTFFNHAGAPSKDAAMPEAKAKQAVQDPLFVNDPWARKQPRTQSTKWEDLLLPTEHPFVNAGGTKIGQTHRLQLQAKPEGLILATKQHLAEISKTIGKNDLAVLLPAADKSSFGDAAPHLTGPHEVILEDVALKTSYKRLVLMFVVRGSVQIKHQAPDCKCTAADFIETVIELDSRVLSASDFAKAKAEPLPTIRSLLAAIVPGIPEHITLYGFRHFKPHFASKDTEQLQVICRTLRKFRAQLLQASGTHGLLVRDFIEKPPDNPDTSVLPRFWDPEPAQLHAMLISTKDVPGAAGIALTRRGLALRVWSTNIAEARKMLMHSDPRHRSE